LQLPKFVRQVTDPIVGRIPVPIVGGINKGMLWSLASSGGGYVSGRRGLEQLTFISALLREGDVVWDVGAHHGSIALCASRRVGKSGSVHAFEPAQLNRTYLERHVRWNRLANVTIHSPAMGSYDGEATFGGSGSSTGYALNKGEEKVQVRTAATIVKTGAAPAPNFAKIDVENLEAGLLQGAALILRPDTRMVISIHSAESLANCTRFLTAAGYTIVNSKLITAMDKAAWQGDPDMICFGPGYKDRDHDRATLESLGF
jgi:FkbM family methyltransferase